MRRTLRTCIMTLFGYIKLRAWMRTCRGLSAITEICTRTYASSAASAAVDRDAMADAEVTGNDVTNTDSVGTPQTSVSIIVGESVFHSFNIASSFKTRVRSMHISEPYVCSRPTQPSIPPGSVNEYQL